MGIIRKTKSVEVLHSAFQETETALSVVELVQRLDSKMNKTTVYRILKRLEEEGQLHSFVDTEGLKWYAKCKDCSTANHEDLHPHFQCQKCGKTECLTMDFSLPPGINHKIESVQMLLLGTCEECLS